MLKTLQLPLLACLRHAEIICITKVQLRFQKQLPVLSLCLQTCYKYYMSDDISCDSDGMDEQCR